MKKSMSTTRQGRRRRRRRRRMYKLFRNSGDELIKFIVVYFTILSVSHTLMRPLVNNELERIWRETIFA
jgi:hypothetical protein